MRAVVFDRFGPPDVLHVAQLPSPVAGEGEVLVKVAAATVNPTDLMMRSGQQAKAMIGLEPPFIAGMEFAGYVHALGGRSSRLEPGQAVMGIVNPRRSQGGAHCEYVCVPEASVVPTPEGLDIVSAATLPMNGLTASMALQALALSAGATLLVTGGAGALGGYVIQMARHMGLHVIADAKEQDRDLLARLGATELVPRGEGMAASIRVNHAAGVDGLVDAALIGNAAAAVVRDGGVVVSVRRTQVIDTQRLKAAYIGVLEQATNTEALASIADLAREGAITPRVAQILSFDHAADAHRLLEQGGLKGRIVLVP